VVVIVKEETDKNAGEEKSEKHSAKRNLRHSIFLVSQQVKPNQAKKQSESEAKPIEKKNAPDEHVASLAP
jgi:hypothetical protein